MRGAIDAAMHRRTRGGGRASPSRWVLERVERRATASGIKERGPKASNRGALQQHPLEVLEAVQVEVADKPVADLELEHGVAVAAHLREETHLEVEDVVVGEVTLGVAPAISPPTASAQRRVAVDAHGLGRPREDDLAVVLPVQQTPDRAHLPLEVSARVVRRATEESEHVVPRAVAVVVTKPVDVRIEAQQRRGCLGEPSAGLRKAFVPVCTLTVHAVEDVVKVHLWRLWLVSVPPVSRPAGRVALAVLHASVWAPHPAEQVRPVEEEVLAHLRRQCRVAAERRNPPSRLRLNGRRLDAAA
mmetsp:Transcript_39299/g.67401  ORF Transcript_39299/g.67401 Transcript_39299/m.67401 type:complete len:302 (+) Transcript_39299:165-1070(+)